MGAPVTTPDHARLAVSAAIEMAAAIAQINESHRVCGLPEIGVGIGLNTGSMCVGDMGSNLRRSYTVIGDAVNLCSRLEGLSKHYGTSIVVSESTKLLAQQFSWQQLDLVRVKGKAQAVAIFSPLTKSDAFVESQLLELEVWGQFLTAYRAQEWAQCDDCQVRLQNYNPGSPLYALYEQRVERLRQQSFDPNWDGATNFDSK